MSLLRHIFKLSTRLPKPLAPLSTTKQSKRTYDPKVVDHFNKPRNVGSLDSSNPNVGTGLVGAPACGDVMRFQIEVDDDGNIVNSCFKTFGCGSAIASSSFATEKVKGLSLEEAGKLTNKDIANELNLPPVKLHCSMLAEDAIRSAINDYNNKKNRLKEEKKREESTQNEMVE